MVRKGTVTEVTALEVVVKLDQPFGALEAARIQPPPGLTKGFEIGDRVFWWPVWSIQRDPGWPVPVQLHSFERLVREDDLSESELVSAAAEVANESENAAAEAAYDALVIARANARDGRHE